MGRYKLSREIAEFKGATKKDPQRYRNKIIKNDKKLISPPDYLPEPVKKIWKEILRDSLPGVITVTDKAMLDLYVRLIYKFRTDFDGMTSAQTAQMFNIASKFGGTPSDRNNFSKPGKAKESSFGEF